MDLPIYVVDAFADRPFTGNPAGVVPLPEPIADSLMQSIASEMNHAETAFLYPNGEAFHLRWFTPEIEVDLCGHATLASAHILYQLGKLSSNEVANFDTRSGRLTAEKTETGLRLDFPALPCLETVEGLKPSIARALKIAPRQAFRSKFDLLVELDGEQSVRELKPDLALLAQLDVRGVIVTAKSETLNVDFISRFFAPNAGVPEDPVTGSAHCCLAPYWGRILGKTKMRAYQASSRGGYIEVELLEDRVLLTGSATTVLSGTLKV
jgi:PhzF family phenazine biosynthesis protein